MREVLSAGSLDNRITEAIGTPILSGHWNIVHVNNGPDVALTFIRAKNPKTKEDLFFGTNKYDLREEEASELYCLRWDIEVAYRDLTHTMKLEQWQSKTMSGILQELYTAIWLYNMIKMHGIKVTKGLDKEYKHSCFTSALKYVSDSVKLLLKNKIDKWRQGLYYILDRTREKVTVLKNSSGRLKPLSLGVEPLG